MKAAHIAAFVDEMEKIANFTESPGFNTFTHGAEVAGLGVLGISSARKLRKINRKETTPQERSDAKKELAGLGILAAPSALHLGHAVYSKLNKVPRV